MPQRAAGSKVMSGSGSGAAAAAVRERLAREGRTLVLCHGCFDVVHPGHIRHLRQASSLGDVLWVSVTPDEGVRKGAGRPFVPQALRAEGLAALDMVDGVVVCEDATAEGLLRHLRPDVYVKGKEYEQNRDPRFLAERACVESYGGRVVFTSGDVVFSSSALIGSIGGGEAGGVRGGEPAGVSRVRADARLAVDGLSRIVSRMRGLRVTVVGEMIRDTYVMCDRPEVAGEGPMLALRPIGRRGYDGGAAVMALQAAALGARVRLVTLMGNDEASREMADRLGACGVEVMGVESGAALPEKQRYLCGEQKVMKVDWVEPFVLDEATHARVAGLAVEACGGGCDAAVIADFGLGMHTEVSLAGLCKALRKRCGVIVGDVSGATSHLASMRGVDLLCPSERELRACVGGRDQGLAAAAWSLLERTHAVGACVTLGADGLIAFTRLPGDAGRGSGAWRTRLVGEHIPAMSVVAVDPLGCGDALTTTAALARAAGGGTFESVFLGACAAAVKVGRLGNAPVSLAELWGVASGGREGAAAVARPAALLAS
ncbi:MAG: adenylyltransferase/cytidyltransferase family protein [Phycisphaeraceae bacterium]|nr:MAG: adenylyltransferase/cytidyltransferase family protein [Phycisphaeraceae bacterium]